MSSAAGPRPVIRPATREDVPLLIELFGELADYEDMRDDLTATEQQLAATLFGERPAASAVIAELGEETAGYALFYPTFSSFLAKPGIWLEDLFVRPAHRGSGVGSALLSALAARVTESGGARLEWCALDWNELALGFYRGLGAQTMDTWITHRLTGEDLARVAAGSAHG